VRRRRISAPAEPVAFEGDAAVDVPAVVLDPDARQPVASGRIADGRKHGRDDVDDDQVLVQLDAEDDGLGIASVGARDEADARRPSVIRR
jgi:hypothetical protein